ncbi:MAG TPA: HD domain-containing protein [Candidatus Paceibacterota bacterium]|nr:HD domain-containing protein [Candidatus Paceibacterota bacterium]
MTTVKEILGAMRDPSPEDEALVRKAYVFAENAHKDHKRYSGEPYFIHPAAVAKYLAETGMDAQTIAAGLLHDAVEDTPVTAEEVEESFGPEVRFLVDGVTKLGQHKYRGAERHAESLRRLLVATSADVRVLIVKLADRYHNMTTLEHVPPEKQRRIALETLEIYAPLADRLGIGRLKKEFEDLAFPAIDPDAYAHAVEVRKLKRKENEEGLARVQKALQHALARRGMRDFKTEIRVKGLWSLHQKLKRKGDDITKIHDIAALRVIVTSIDDCYQVLGVVHANWKPLPGEFKDYIAFPKPNGYQSLHTTVLTSDAGVVEIQIRTEEMHQRAQFGIASHMSYKHLGKQMEQRRAGTQKRAFEKVSIHWIRDLIPGLLNFSRKPAPKASSAPSTKKKAEQPMWLNELADAHIASIESKEFVEGLKEDFFSHRVFVFTPKGDVIDLPVQSTPIDFAYAIHSELGNHMHGAKVNGKLVTFDTMLRNGDIVEILERQNAHPTAKWLDYARTGMARRHIRNAIEAESIKLMPQAEAKIALAARKPTPRKRKKTPKPKKA